MENGHVRSDHRDNEDGESAVTAPLVSEKRKPIRLSSPGGANSMTFYFNQSSNSTHHLIALDILEIIKTSMALYPDIDKTIQDYCKIEDVNVHNYPDVRSLCKKFNKAVEKMLEKKGLETPAMMDKDIFRQVYTRCYNKAVDNEKALNKHYEAFSSETYGETSYDRMQLILEELQPTENDVFVDLGSGVGQLVVHVAGASCVKKAIGIEIAQLPAKFATSLEGEFRKWMAFYGKAHSLFELHHGDFLDDKFRDLILNEATIIFINNYAFRSDLEARIKRELLSELKHGTRIVSSKPFVPPKKGAITDRQLNDISVIIDISEMRQCPKPPCSWTNTYVPYYLQVINCAKLERYFTDQKLRNGRSNDGSRRSSTPSSKASNSRESSVGVKDREYSSRNGFRNRHQNDDEIPKKTRKIRKRKSLRRAKAKKKSVNKMEEGEKGEL